MILGKALVTDRAHRPDDIGALAKRCTTWRPADTIPPPPADESHLDHGADFEVDVSLSMLPPGTPALLPQVDRPAAGARGTSAPLPAPRHGFALAGVDPYAMAVIEAPRRRCMPTIRRRDWPT